MSSSQKQYILYNLLTSNRLTSDELTSVLGESGYSAAFSDLISKRNYAEELGRNQSILDIIVNSVSGAIYAAQNERFIRNVMLDGQCTKSFILSNNVYGSLTTESRQILADITSGEKYKLKRTVYTNSGATVWNVDTSTILAGSILCIGGGSSGGSTNGSANGKVGGGGAALTITTYHNGWPTGAGGPAGQHTIFVGAGGAGVQGNGAAIGGASSSIHSYETGGNIAYAAGGNGDQGGGTTASGGVSSITDLDFLNAFWQFNSCSVKGGNGGGISTSGQMSGISGTGGSAGAGSTAGGGGTAYCNGGGGGASNGGGATSNVAGNSAPANSGSGGGGCTVLSAAATMSGGSGGSGLVVIHYILV